MIRFFLKQNPFFDMAVFLYPYNVPFNDVIKANVKCPKSTPTYKPHLTLKYLFYGTFRNAKKYICRLFLSTFDLKC